MAKSVPSNPYARNGKLKSRFRTLKVVCEYAQANNGVTPTVTDIAVRRQRSRQLIYSQIDELVELGYLEWRDGKIVILDSTWLPPDGIPED